MYPREFAYVAPSSLDDVIRILADEPGAKLMAGGHSLLPLMKLRLLSPELVVDLGRIPDLDYVADRGDVIAVGPMATHRQAASSGVLRRQATALAEAAAVVGDVQVRNRGTVLGSLAHADSVADEPGAAIALDAVMVARSQRGERHIPAADFFVDTLTSALDPDEMLVELRIPKEEGAAASAYRKLGRRGHDSDYPIAGAAAAVGLRDGRVAVVRVAVTGVASRATAVTAARALVGAAAGDDTIAAVAAAAQDELVPLADIYGSAEYRRHLVGVFVTKALVAAVTRAEAASTTS